MSSALRWTASNAEIDSLARLSCYVINNCHIAVPDTETLRMGKKEPQLQENGIKEQIISVSTARSALCGDSGASVDSLARYYVASATMLRHCPRHGKAAHK
jgi:hypothetical protein